PSHLSVDSAGAQRNHVCLRCFPIQLSRNRPADRVGSVLGAIRSPRAHHPSEPCCLPRRFVFPAPGSCTTYCNLLLFQPLTAHFASACSASGQLLTGSPSRLFQTIETARSSPPQVFGADCR